MPTALAPLYQQDTVTESDEDTGEQTVVAVGDPYLVHYTHAYAVSIVGILQEPTGNTITDADGIEYDETAPINGWHINIRLVGDSFREQVESINDLYGVVVNSPTRQWL
jgi:hypothetical protein